jgi:hypothetical protein
MPANINLNLASFVDISAGGQFCQASMTLGAGPAGNVTLRNGILVVKGGAAMLQFTIVPPAGSTDSFLALGLAFQGPSTDPRGQQSFEINNLRLNGATLTIRDNFAKHGPQGSAPTYQFFVFIQRVSDGAMGIVHPDIQNED